MRSYKDILSFLIIREQLSLGWKILFFIVCGALVYGSATLMNVRVQSVDLVGTVISHGADPSDEGHNPYLVVQLDDGQTVKVRFVGSLDYRPKRRGVVREITTNFFGLKKYEFKHYLDQSSDQ